MNEMQDVSRISLSQSQFALVDPEDHDRLSGFRWSYKQGRDGVQGYAVRHLSKQEGYRLSYLHREIMNPADGCEVIFLNHDRLDCRRANLKVVTKAEAKLYHRVRSDSESGIKGLKYNESSRMWYASFYRNRVGYFVGAYETKEMAMEELQRAIAAYDTRQAAKNEKEASA